MSGFIRVNPPKISAADLGTKITVNAFRSRFTPAEELAFENALSGSADLRVLDKRLVSLVATYVDMNDPTYAKVAMPALVSANVLTEIRANEILTASVQWHELPPSIQQRFINAGYDIDV